MKLFGNPKFTKAMFLTSVVTALIVACGCSATPTWLTDAQQLLPVVVSTITGILGLVSALSGKTIPTDVVTTITKVANDVQSSLTNLETLIQQYNSAAASAQAGILGEITTATNIILSDLTVLEQGIGITDTATQAKIAAIATLVANELKAWLTLIPVLKAAAGSTFTITVPQTAASFKQAYNLLIEAPTGEADVDQALKGLKKL